MKISAGLAEVKKKDEDGARAYQSAGKAHRTTMVEGGGTPNVFGGWRLRDGFFFFFFEHRTVARVGEEALLRGLREKLQTALLRGLLNFLLRRPLISKFQYF